LRDVVPFASSLSIIILCAAFQPAICAAKAAILDQIESPYNGLCRIIHALPAAPLSRPCIMNKADKKIAAAKQIAANKKARYDFFIENTFEAGLALEGWEVKSLRDGRAQLAESYVHIRDGEAWLFGAHISPLNTASTHIRADATRTRKLLLHRVELDRLIGAVERKGYTLVPLNLHWTRGRVKLDVGLAKGKKQHDKRATQKDRDWQRQKARILKSSNQ
jgi:SsrA-binding protein